MRSDQLDLGGVLVTIYAEDGITPLGKGPVHLSAGKAYQLVVSGGG